MSQTGPDQIIDADSRMPLCEDVKHCTTGIHVVFTPEHPACVILSPFQTSRECPVCASTTLCIQ